MIKKLYFQLFFVCASFSPLQVMAGGGGGGGGGGGVGSSVPFISHPFVAILLVVAIGGWMASRKQ